MKSPNTKSSDQLKNEVHQDLKKVERSFDELQRRLTPGQILDDVVFYPHNRSISGSIQHLKENPVGTTFLSLGMILLMEDKSHHTLESTTKHKITSAQNAAREKIKNMKEKLQSKFPEERRETLKEKVSEKIQDLKMAIETKASEMREESSEAKQKVNIQEQARKVFHAGREKIHEMDSLSFLALGMGLGALTGSSIPLIGQEEEFIHHKFGERLSQLSDDLEQAINESSNILKELVINDLKDYELKIFKEE
jgi:flagellar biosynthesis GTPase FlhF